MIVSALLLSPLLGAQATKPSQASGSDGTVRRDASAGPLYKVEDGNKVDPRTLDGWRTWRALACDRCHGPEQQGLVGPSLLESMKRLTKEQFHDVIMNGRIEKGMPGFSTSKMVTENWEGLYAYLKGRSDGEIKPGRLSALTTTK